jgi:hypothetical protein
MSGLVSSAVLAIIDPGQGTAPPGSGNATKLISWGAWGVFAVCVLGVLLAAGQMAIAHHRGGGGGEHAARLGWVLVAAVVAGSASALIAAIS